MHARAVCVPSFIRLTTGIRSWNRVRTILGSSLVSYVFGTVETVCGLIKHAPKKKRELICEKSLQKYFRSFF